MVGGYEGRVYYDHKVGGRAEVLTGREINP